MKIKTTITRRDKASITGVHRFTSKLTGRATMVNFSQTARNLKDLGRGSWFQWGAPKEDLGACVELTEKLTNEWIEEFHE